MVGHGDVNEGSFTSFKMSQLPKVCQMLTYSKSSSDSVRLRSCSLLPYERTSSGKGVRSTQCTYELLGLEVE